ncbi:MAG: phenylalanine--tRNA ligase subunit beta [Nitrososphaerota archaeon]|nr:phenylalanine--tRNA ligase subunit beta [Candidatus Calditenuaceae archaeon]MDW8072984.1 phenylalanine--tRNA ligase subunit beta [Nitrososphaerota archaeon]
MPALTLNVNRLSRLVGKELTPGEIAELTASLGMSVEEVSDTEVKVEYNPNRPDFGCHVSLARALRGILGIELGSRRYSARGSSVAVEAEPSVEAVRPIIACALVRSLTLGEEEIADLIVLQEDLHWVLGRDRRKVAIGLHDYTRVRPPFIYRGVGLSDIRFIPLGSYEEMTPQEILEEHPTGKKYSWILKGKNLAPIILDSRGNVLSFPPIINASLTELRPGAKDIFIDVTGTDEKAVNQALNILVTTLIDMGGVAYQTLIRYVGRRRKVYTPDLTPSKWVLDPKYVSTLIGLDASGATAVKALKRMRMNARLFRGKVLVEVPPYRVDILHQVDLVEDVAIGMGYHGLEPVLPATAGLGALLESSRILALIRPLMLAMGYTEVVNTTLSHSERDFKWMLIPGEPGIRILNPVSTLYDSMREMLLPGLLSNLAANSMNPYPQRIFELGDVMVRDDTLPERARRETHLAFATCHSTASFSEIKSHLEEIFRTMELDARLSSKDYPFFIPGRGAAVLLGEVEVGFMGEVHPAVLENFGLYMPTAGCELNLSLAGLF